MTCQPVVAGPSPCPIGTSFDATGTFCTVPKIVFVSINAFSVVNGY